MRKISQNCFFRHRSQKAIGDVTSLTWLHRKVLGGTGNLGEFCLVFADLEVSNIGRILTKISDLHVLQD